MPFTKRQRDNCSKSYACSIRKGLATDACIMHRKIRYHAKITGILLHGHYSKYGRYYKQEKFHKGTKYLAERLFMKQDKNK